MPQSLQRLVKEFNEEFGLNIELTPRLLDLSSELGEVCKLGFGEELGKGISPEKSKEELGDVLYSLLCIYNLKGIRVEESLSGVIEKYKARISAAGSAESGQ